MYELLKMNITEDIAMFCRVCLQLPSETEMLDLNLIYDEEEQLTYSDCFTMCTKINICEDENLPQNLCRSCGLELQMAYDFHRKVEESKRLLIQLQEQQQTESTAVVTEVDIGGINGSQESNQEVVVEEEEHLDMEEYQAEEHLDEEGEYLGEYCQDIVENDEEEKRGFSSPNECVEEPKCDIDKNENEADDEELIEKKNLNTPKMFTTPIAAFNQSVQPFVPPVIRTSSPSSALSCSALNCILVTCDVCGKMFPNKSRMLWHRRIHDQNRVKYSCPQSGCKRVYATKQACDVHYKQTHLVEGLACPVCRKIFIVRQSLEVHMRYHKGDFPYKCDVCDKRYGQKGHLTTHMQVKHNNLRYYCSEPGCVKTFKNSMSLRNHRFVHSEMPFKCALCEKGYPQKSKLKAHINGKHNLSVSLEELESMRKFQEGRTRYSFMKIETVEKEEVTKKDKTAVSKI